MKADIQFNTSSESLNLPFGWRWVKLGEVCNIVSGTTPKSGISTFWNGEIVWVTPTDLGKLVSSYIYDSERKISETGFSSCNLTLLPVGSIVLSSRAPIGYLAITSIPLCTNQGCKSFIAGSTVDTNFLFYTLKLSVKQLQNIGSGATFAEISKTQLENFIIPLPSLPEQKRIAAILNEQMVAVDKARTAAEAQLEAAIKLQYAYVQETLKLPLKSYSVSECFTEVSTGVGSTWSEYPVLGATRSGLAPAKDPVGSRPGRYKLADVGTIFYNPMRILIGSIALVDDSDIAGITSPDYVVLKAKEGILHYRWFYHWLRSSHGEHFIKSLARGAVRERILFNRLIQGSIDLPSYESQLIAAEKIAKIKPLITGIEEQLKYVNALPSIILRKAFSGGF